MVYVLVHHSLDLLKTELNVVMMNVKVENAEQTNKTQVVTSFNGLLFKCSYLMSLLSEYPLTPFSIMWK